MRSAVATRCVEAAVGNRLVCLDPPSSRYGAAGKRGSYNISDSGPKFLLRLILATVLIGMEPRVLANAANISRVTSASTPTPTPFSHPLLLPPVNSNSNVSIGIDQACVQILDGPCTNMWTYGGTFPGITIRRPTGQTTNVTFTNNLDPAAGELTVHNHGNHSTAANDGQPDSLLIPTGGSRTYIYDGLEEGGNQRGKMQFYHDHRMDVTGRNVWMGLTGMYIVDDPADPRNAPLRCVRPASGNRRQAIRREQPNPIRV